MTAGSTAGRRPPSASVTAGCTDLRATGELRVDLTDDEIADVVRSTVSAELRVLLVGERGWSAERYAAWLADGWQRLLLA